MMTISVDVDIDEWEVLPQISDKSLLAECESRKLTLGKSADLVKQALAYLRDGDVNTAERKLVAALAEAEKPGALAEAWDAVKLGKHPFLVRP